MLTFSLFFFLQLLQEQAMLQSKILELEQQKVTAAVVPSDQNPSQPNESEPNPSEVHAAGEGDVHDNDQDTSEGLLVVGSAPEIVAAGTQ
jgi:hypothetical protein